MNCITCNQLLDIQTAGFIMCPNCGTANIPQASTSMGQINNVIVVSESTDSLSEKAPSPNIWQRIGMTKHPLVAARGLSAIILLACLCLGSFFLYQNHRANDLLNSAQSNIRNSNYAAALTQLETAQHYYSIPSVHNQIITAQTKDKTWVSDDQELKLAERFTVEGKYSQATAQLAKVSKDFPAYPKVLSLLQNIAVKEAAATKAAADVAAAVSAVKPVNKAAPKPISTTATKAATVPAATASKRFTSTAAANTLAAATSITQAQQALQTFVSQYNLIMQITNVPATSGSTYNLPTNADLNELKTYGALFIDEWAKYPTDWVASSKLSAIAIVKDLAVSGTHRAAMPSPTTRTMFYDAGYSGDYAREVIHHEYDHFITYEDFGSYAPSDPTWLSYNPSGFNYGGGGASCYQPGNSCLSGQHPIPGFVTGYGASAIEEDKAELYAYLMTGSYYHQLLGWLPGDTHLASKVANYKQFISSRSSEMSGNYFSAINP